MLRVFIFPYACHFWGPDREASIVTSDFQPRERLYALFLHLFQDRLIAEKVQGISNGDISFIREMDFLGVFLDLFFHCFKSAVTGHARDQQLAIALFGDRKVPGSQFDG
jgi:hypothetical protein